jgi:hypothetical protein
MEHLAVQREVIAGARAAEDACARGTDHVDAEVVQLKRVAIKF